MSPRARSTSIAASRSASPVLSANSSAAARACSMRRFTPASLSRASARSNAGNAAGSCEWNTASAASRRVAASGANMRRLPSAASTSPRTALFMRTCLRPLDMMSGAGLPLAASMNEPSLVLMNSALSAVRANRRFPCSADRMAAACGWPDTASTLDPLPDRVVARRCQRGERVVRRLRTGYHGCQCQCGDQQQPGETLHRHAFSSRGGGPGRKRATPMGMVSSGRHAFLPPPAPHLPVLTLNAPQESGARQSPIRSFVSSTYGDHSCATTRPGVCETVLNWPSD